MRREEAVTLEDLAVAWFASDQTRRPEGLLLLLQSCGALWRVISVVQQCFNLFSPT